MWNRKCAAEEQHEVFVKDINGLIAPATIQLYGGNTPCLCCFKPVKVTAKVSMEVSLKGIGRRLLFSIEKGDLYYLYLQYRSTGSDGGRGTGTKTKTAIC